MDSPYRTSQEAAWAGDFGDAYVERNQGAAILATKLHTFVHLLEGTQGVSSVLEFGANIGLNMRALRLLVPHARLAAVEINAKAFERLATIEGVEAHHGSLLDFDTEQLFDLTFTAGVMIHLNPERLNDVYDRLYRFSNRYIALVEYFNPTPVEVRYRGRDGLLFKRDFAGEMLDRFTDLEVVAYGCKWSRAPIFPQDDPNWYLLQKR